MSRQRLEERYLTEPQIFLGFSVPELCFEPNDRLDITEYTQAAMVTTSIAMMKVLEERGIHPDVAAGLSLGEYCALAAAGVMSEDDAIRTVRQRGILMQEEVPAGEALWRLFWHGCLCDRGNHFFYGRRMDCQLQLSGPDRYFW